MRRARIAGLIAAAVLAGPPSARAALPAPAPAPLVRSLGQLRALTAEEAGKGLPVKLTGVVTYYHHEWEMLFIQDETSAAFVYVDHRTPRTPMEPGTLVE